MKISLIRSIAIASALLMSNHVYAERYLGAGLGNASYDTPPISGSFNIKNGLALRAFVGTKSKYVGLEAEATASEHDWEGTGVSTYQKVLNIVFSVVGYLPISGNVNLYGKAGFNRWLTTVNVSGATSERHLGSDSTFGLGVDFSVTKSTHTRLQYTLYEGIDNGFEVGDIGLLSVDIVHHF